MKTTYPPLTIEQARDILRDSVSEWQDFERESDGSDDVWGYAGKLAEAADGLLDALKRDPDA
jgi:hypothetical protein